MRTMHSTLPKIEEQTESQFQGSAIELDAKLMQQNFLTAEANTTSEEDSCHLTTQMTKDKPVSCNTKDASPLKEMESEEQTARGLIQKLETLNFLCM